MFVTLVHCHVKPEHADAFEDACRENCEASSRENGNVRWWFALCQLILVIHTLTVAGHVKEIRGKNIPVIDVINGISAPELSAKSLVSFYDMGLQAAKYIAKQHPAGSGKVKVAWFPGPPGAGWVEDGNKGFLEGVKGSDIEVVETKYGDTGKEVQLKLVEDTLESYPDIKYIVGTSPTADAAIGLLRDRGLTDKVSVMAYYFTPPVYEGIKAGTILAAPTDSAVIQGRVAIDQVVRLLEGKEAYKRVSPQIYVIDKSNIGSFDYNSSLAPPDFKPTFSVD